MKIAIFEDGEQVEYIELPGDVSNYDIVINSSSRVEFPPKQIDERAPEVPEIDTEEIERQSNQRTYRRMRDSTDSQAAEIREAIYQRQVLTREQLDAWLESEGYSPRSGTVTEALIVLESITEEINRIGEGDEMQIIWVGET